MTKAKNWIFLLAFVCFGSIRWCQWWLLRRDMTSIEIMKNAFCRAKNREVYVVQQFSVYNVHRMCHLRGRRSKLAPYSQRILNERTQKFAVKNSNYCAIHIHLLQAFEYKMLPHVDPMSMEIDKVLLWGSSKRICFAVFISCSYFLSYFDFHISSLLLRWLCFSDKKETKKTENVMFFRHFVCHGKVLFAQIFTYTLT